MLAPDQLIGPVTASERLIAARSFGRRVMLRHGDAVLGIAVSHGTAKDDRPDQAVRLAVVLADTVSVPPLRLVRRVEGCRLIAAIAPRAEWERQAGRLHLDWPLEGPAFYEMVTLFDTGSTLADITRTEAQREAADLPRALIEALDGPVANLAGTVTEHGTSDRLVPFAWAAARFVALANRHVFADPAQWVAETLTLARRPAGWEAFVEAIGSGAPDAGSLAMAVIADLPRFAGGLVPNGAEPDEMLGL